MEDACWDSKRPGEEIFKGFAHCLYSVNDTLYMEFQGIGDSRYENLMKDPHYVNELKKIIDKYNEYAISRGLRCASRYRRKARKKLKDSYLKRKPDVVIKYGDCSEPIDIEKYKKALGVVYSMTSDDSLEVELKVEREIDLSIAFGAASCDLRSSNVFASQMNKKERKAMYKKF